MEAAAITQLQFVSVASLTTRAMTQRRTEKEGSSDEELDLNLQKHTVFRDHNFHAIWNHQTLNNNQGTLRMAKLSLPVLGILATHAIAVLDP